MVCLHHSDAFSGQGHSFHGTGGRGGKKAQMRYCIRVLRSVVCVGNELLIQDLCDQGAIGQLLGKKCPDPDPDPNRNTPTVCHY